jgi:5-methylcytosine-specific restriction endonuclease McrA
MTARAEHRRGWLFALRDSPGSDWGSVEKFYDSILRDFDANPDGRFESGVRGNALGADSRLEAGDGIAFYHSRRARFPARDRHQRRQRISLIAELIDVEQEGREVVWIEYRVRRSILERFRASPLVWTPETDHIFRSTGIGSGPIATFYPLSAAIWSEIETISGATLSEATAADRGNTTRVGASVSEPPRRVAYETVRIVRDTKTARALKVMYNHECQVCGETILLENGERYSEAHHIRPLGRGHDGPDIRENMLVLCPNHHAVFDLGAARFESPTSVRIGTEVVELTLRHDVAASSLKYHNEHIAFGGEPPTTPESAR